MAQSAQSRCQRLINAIARAPTPALRGEAINKETFYLSLPKEPTKPITHPLWTDIRTSKFGEVLLSIVTNSNNPLSDGEVHFRISSLQVLHYITGTMEWDSAGGLEIQLRSKVFKLNEQLQRLKAYSFTNSRDLPMARAFAVFIMSTTIESARYGGPFLNALLQNKEPLLRTLYAVILDPAHIAAISTSADPGLVQKALVIFSILSDNFETDNKEAKNAISLYQVRTVVDRFSFMLQNPLYSDTKLSGMLSGMSALLHHLWSEKSIIAPMVTQGRIHVLMMTSFWAYQSQRPDDRAGFSPYEYTGYCFRSDMVEYLARVQEEGPSISQRVFCDLLVDCDFMPAYGMGLVGTEARPSVDKVKSVQGFTTLVWQHCILNPDVARNYVIPAWLRVMDALRRVDISRGPLLTQDESQGQVSTITLWSAFGDRLGIKETEVRASIQRKGAGIDHSDFITCNNVKCPLFGENILGRLDTPLRCSGCRSSYYCSLGCQKIDWKRRHKSQCHASDVQQDNL